MDNVDIRLPEAASPDDLRRFCHFEGDARVAIQSPHVEISLKNPVVQPARDGIRVEEHWEKAPPQPELIITDDLTHVVGFTEKKRLQDENDPLSSWVVGKNTRDKIIDREQTMNAQYELLYEESIPKLLAHVFREYIARSWYSEYVFREARSTLMGTGDKTDYTMYDRLNPQFLVKKQVPRLIMARMHKREEEASEIEAEIRTGFIERQQEALRLIVEQVYIAQPRSSRPVSLPIVDDRVYHQSRYRWQIAGDRW